ncbi:chitin deacetylase 1 [Hetaerina americana]|uniref:chitin deacetylase 1 n=1 Tax=Hetaerina americana TaxID=62018 RepID=UPI003A7F62A3
MGGTCPLYVGVSFLLLLLHLAGAASVAGDYEESESYKSGTDVPQYLRGNPKPFNQNNTRQNTNSVWGRQRRRPNKVPCLVEDKFYRNPNRKPNRVWSNTECSKYYLCLDGEVFEFRCSTGLLFDINRQICDFKLNIDNCHITAELKSPRPLLENADCPEDELGCADGTCISQDMFCDGTPDCDDDSDEGWCDVVNDPNAATPCDPITCKLPDCFCSVDGTAVPGNMLPSQIPQMIILTFDDAVNADNWELFQDKLFPTQSTTTRVNPNGCPIHATFFISHQYTNYQQVQKLWNQGHEISVHSITHRGPEQWWTNNATIEDWFDEMVGQANIINRFANVRMEDIRGLRVPFLRVGWNRQFSMMREFGFVYDASIAAPFSDPPLWPYTLDHRMPHVCVGGSGTQRCPTRSQPGIWEMVMNQLEMEGYQCAMVDSCPQHLTGKEIYNGLMRNFHRHYDSNRAPYGLYFHSTWFKKPDFLSAFQKFLDEMGKHSDVWFVTNWQAVQWMKNPVPLGQVEQFKPWSCKRREFTPLELACNLPKTCRLQSRDLGAERYLYTCTDCPQIYPWLRNEFGVNV